MSPNTSPVLESWASMTPVVHLNGDLPEWADYDSYAIYVLIAKFVMLNIKLSSIDPSPACKG